MDSTVNRARTGGNQFFLKMEGNINQLIIDETFNPGQIKSKETTPVSTRITRRREESLHQRPNEEGEKDQRED